MLSVERVDNLSIDRIKIGKRRRQDMGDIQELADNIDARGLIHPIVVKDDMTLLAGERRLRAHMLLNRTTIRADVVTLDSKDSSRKAIELFENVMRLNFTWSERALLEKDLFDAQAAENPDWSLRKQADLIDTSKTQIGKRIQLAEAIELIPELGLCETQDEAWKLFKRLEEDIVVGQLKQKMPDATINAPHWAREHYVVSDALDGMAPMADESFDFAEVDPPYAIELDRRKSRNLDNLHTKDYTEITPESFPPFMQHVIAETFRLLRHNSFGVFWYGMQWHCDMYTWLTKAGFAVNPVPAIWYKGNVGQTAQPDVALASTYEPFWLARKGTPKMKRMGRGNVFHYESVSPSKKIHTTEKPIELLSDILNTILFPGSNILVPFLGSGVTLRAAYRLGHTGLGFDRSQAHKERFLELVAGEHPEADPEGDAE